MTSVALREPGIAIENLLSSFHEGAPLAPARKLKPTNDPDLIAEALAGNDAAFSALVQPYRKLFTSGIHRILLDDQDTQRALDKSLLRINAELPHFLWNRGFPAWAYRLCLNEALLLRRFRAQAQEPGPC